MPSQADPSNMMTTDGGGFMGNLATERDIVTIPKVELHVHLNGSITERTASRDSHGTTWPSFSAAPHGIRSPRRI
jgi:hypothetical protein